MKPIALVTSQFPPQVGGVGHSAARVARLLARSGKPVHVVAFQKHAEPVALDEAITSTREDELIVHRVLIHHPPGGSEAAARLHLARAVCRRAETVARASAEERPVNPLAHRGVEVDCATDPQPFAVFRQVIPIAYGR